MNQERIPDDQITAAAPETVVQQYQGWVFKIANRYAGLLEDDNAITRDDLFQAGIVGLLEAQRNYDPDRGSKFITFSFKLIRNSMLNQLGFQDKSRHRPPAPLISLDESISDEGEDTLLDILQDPDAVPVDEQIADYDMHQRIAAAVRDAVERLESDRQRMIIRRVWLDEVPRKDVAEELQIPLRRIQNIDRDGRNKLRKDNKLREYLEMPFFHVGLARFNSSWTSATEKAVLWLEEYRKGMTKAGENDDD